jgi:hypothetical protein
MTVLLAIPAAALDITVNKAGITVDGARDEAYSGPIAIASPHGETPASAAKGNAWIAWEDGALFIYAEITDKTPNHNTDDGDVDNLETFIDWKNVGAAGGGGEITGRNADDTGWDYVPGTAAGFPYWQVRVPAAPNLDGQQDVGGAVWSDLDWGAVDWGAADAAAATAFVTKPIDGDYKNGYIVESRIGVPAGVALAEGMMIPMDFQICDNIEGAGARNGQMFPVASEYNDMQWAVPSTCKHAVTLGGSAAPAAAEPAAPPEQQSGGEEAAPAEDAPAPAPAAPAVSNPKVGDNGTVVLLAGIMLAAAAIFRKKITYIK